ncbi:hypothetical protein SRABI26_02698 [Arthrobacter sp. Bi26]|uniref:hypothetical protein n=1 Tax=Arthrobacter sp. Bi26 TaxID=2822350 RepID=UPI001DD954DF|nr:hypothetical protein [Arthrobacter sp. Bi26]CAH0233065.1 hypothetical protein SRABI26_02698 [Arthrobacter sp. Bi26]
MHLSVEAAALLAQVFPTLLIALLLEGKFVKRDGRKKRLLKVLMLLRLAAVLTSLAATFICLLVVVTEGSNPFADIWVTGTWIILFFAFLVMCGEVFDREILEHSSTADAVPADAQAVGVEGIEARADA